jgi:hypothetical protein
MSPKNYVQAVGQFSVLWYEDVARDQVCPKMGASEIFQEQASELSASMFHHWTRFAGRMGKSVQKLSEKMAEIIHHRFCCGNRLFFDFCKFCQ